jgi:AcrR family transcriptional regulator
MNMASDFAVLRRRVPQQERGERRVAELLDAAAAVIAEVGYEAATMTEMAQRARASIGALYQYFPNKEAVVRALRTQYGEEMEERWKPLKAQAAGLSMKQLVDRLYAVMIQMMDERPAYIPLLSAPVNYKRDPAARDRLRMCLADLLSAKCPTLSPKEAFRMANVVLQVIKGLNPLYAEAKPDERKELVQEFKLVMTAYLSLRLKA